MIHKTIVKPIAEQIAHLSIGGLIAAMIGYLMVSISQLPYLVWVGILVSIIVCLVREFVIQRPIERWWDTMLDTFFWVSGAVIGGVVVYGWFR